MTKVKEGKICSLCSETHIYLPRSCISEVSPQGSNFNQGLDCVLFHSQDCSLGWNKTISLHGALAGSEAIYTNLV